MVSIFFLVIIPQSFADADYIDLNYDTEKQIVVFTWDFTEIEDAEECNLKIHVIFGDYDSAENEYPGTQRYGFVGIDDIYTLDTTSGEANDLFDARDGSEISCSGSLVVEANNYSNYTQDKFVLFFIFEIDDKDGNTIETHEIAVQEFKLQTIENALLEAGQTLDEYVKTCDYIDDNDSYVEIIGYADFIFKGYADQTNCADDDFLDVNLDYVYVYVESSRKTAGTCSDCVAPTIEITQNQNLVTISAWEEKGPYYIQLTELSLDTATIQVWMGYWLYQDIPNVKEIKTIDPDGILESSNAVVSTVDCDKKIECLHVHFLYDLTKVSDISITTSDFYKNSVTELLD